VFGALSGHSSDENVFNPEEIISSTAISFAATDGVNVPIGFSQVAKTCWLLPKT
jgi:hypothetical protein